MSRLASSVLRFSRRFRGSSVSRLPRPVSQPLPPLVNECTQQGQSRTDSCNGQADSGVIASNRLDTAWRRGGIWFSMSEESKN